MNNIILNQGQQLIYDAAINWYYNSSDTLFQIASEAGCGKSVLVGEIVKGLGLRNDEILPMAYTGQAAIVMRLHGLEDAKTCHSGLFMPIQVHATDGNGKYLMDTRFNTYIYKWKFIPKDFSNSNIKLIILDEAWMVPRKFRKFIDDTGIKVIATGDPGQLPPIADDPGYFVDGNIYYLTEIMRQEQDSALVYLAHRARYGYPIDYGLYGNDVFVIFDDELDDELLMKANVVLCGKNDTRDIVNRRVREDILHFYNDTPNFGERVICRKNNWGIIVDDISLVNGLTGNVISQPDIGKYDGKTIKIDFLPDLTTEPFIDIPINRDYINAKDKKQREFLKANPYLQGELFEYAYASTVHLAQGSEYNCGIYFEEYMGQPVWYQNALNYTAITRFRNKLIYVKHKPKFWSF